LTFIQTNPKLLFHTSPYLMSQNKNSVCPIGSEPYLAATYKSIGTEHILEGGDLPCYIVGDGPKSLIFGYDVFGFNGGRTRLMCDQFASAGYSVILPDFFRGDSAVKHENFGFVQQYTWAKVNKDLTQSIYPYLNQRGIRRIGFIGACWGAYIAMKACASQNINVGISFHPSLKNKPETIEELARGVTCPQLILAAGNDPEEVKEGGIVERILKEKEFGEKVKIKTFEDMKHGWMIRGDLEREEVARDVKIAMEMSLDFLKLNL